MKQYLLDSLYISTKTYLYQLSNMYIQLIARRTTFPRSFLASGQRFYIWLTNYY